MTFCQTVAHTLNLSNLRVRIIVIVLPYFSFWISIFTATSCSAGRDVETRELSYFVLTCKLFRLLHKPC